jgi:hypothetical protein
MSFFLRRKTLHRVEAKPLQSDTGGLKKFSVDTIAPFFRRGVLLDVAAHLGKDALPTDFSVTPAHLDAAAKAQRVTNRKGDVILLRTGWARYWNDAGRYITGGQGVVASGPGPQIAGARAGSANAESWLSGPIRSRSSEFPIPRCRCTCTYSWRAEFTSSKP